MTIRSKTEYNQRAHEQPTQASEWAAQHGAGADAQPVARLLPKRLTGPELESLYPGWTADALKSAHRPDGGNGG